MFLLRETYNIKTARYAGLILGYGTTVSTHGLTLPLCDTACKNEY